MFDRAWRVGLNHMQPVNTSERHMARAGHISGSSLVTGPLAESSHLSYGFRPSLCVFLYVCVCVCMCVNSALLIALRFIFNQHFVHIHRFPL